MMSAHDVAIAALKEVASTQESDPQMACELSQLMKSPAAASIKPTTSTSRDILLADPRDAHASGGRLSSSSNNSQSTLADVSTPPTSDSFSSQSQESQSQISQLSQAATTQHHLLLSADIVPPPLSVATNAGQKRTRDGYVKSPESSSSASPPVASFGGHTRHTSNINTVLSISGGRELASELKTRLSYALVKVTKGWEAIPIEEAESLASQAVSPDSSASMLHDRRNITTSPRTAIATIQGHAREIAGRHNAALLSQCQPDLTSYVNCQPSRTYESFWREQSQKQSGLSPNLGPPASTSSPLAPPVDFTPTRHSSHPRRSATPRFTRPPMLVGHSTSDLSQSSQHSKSAAPPRTPNRASDPVDVMFRSPDPKSLQERDAIETLLFMSSPGNSSTVGHSFPAHGQASQYPSPLRGEFATLRGVQERSSELAGAGLGPSRDELRHAPSARRARLKMSGKPGDDDLDKMLDNMADSQSSDEDEVEIVTPRRLAAGGA